MISYRTRHDAQRTASIVNQRPRAQQWAAVVEHNGRFVVVMQDHPAVEAQPPLKRKVASPVAIHAHTTERTTSQPDAFMPHTRPDTKQAALEAQRVALRDAQRRTAELLVWQPKISALLTMIGTTSNAPHAPSACAKATNPRLADTASCEALATDGPSLLVAANQGAPYRFPHRRLSRVVVSGALPQHSNGLIDCAADNIPVFLLKGNGKLACMILPPAPPRTALTDLLERIDGERSLAHTYSHWLENQRAHLMAKAVTHLGLQVRGRQKAREVLQREAKLIAREEHRPLPYEALNNLVNSQLVERLVARQLDMRKPSVDSFRRELLELFEPFVLLMAALHGGSQASVSSLASCFDQHQAWLDTEISRLLVQLESQFAEEL